MLTSDAVIAAAEIGCDFDKLDESDEIIAYLPIAWVGDHIFSYAQAILAGLCVNCPESPETVVEDRREIGATYVFAPPRVFESMLTLTMVRMEDASALKRRMFKILHRPRQQGRREDPEQGAGCRPVGPPPLAARQRARLRAAAQPLRHDEDQGRLHGGRGDRPGDLPLLPLDRREPEAALRPDGSLRLHHHAAQRRDPRRHGRPPCPAGRDPHRRQRRGALPLARRVRGLLQGRREDGRDQDAGRLRAFGRRRLLRRRPAISRSSTGPRTWARCATARCSRRNTSRTS